MFTSEICAKPPNVCYFLEALPTEFRSRLPWAMLYTYDLMIIAESLEDTWHSKTL